LIVVWRFSHGFPSQTVAVRAVQSKMTVAAVTVGRCEQIVVDEGQARCVQAGPAEPARGDEHDKIVGVRAVVAVEVEPGGQ
jgi:hypothetical protein